MIVLKKTFDKEISRMQSICDKVIEKNLEQNADILALRNQIDLQRALISEKDQSLKEALDIVNARLTDLMMKQNPETLIKAIIVAGMLSGGSTNTPNHITHLVRLAEAYSTSLGGKDGDEGRNA